MTEDYAFLFEANNAITNWVEASIEQQLREINILRSVDTLLLNDHALVACMYDKC